MCRVCLFYAEAVKKMQREAVIFATGAPPSLVRWSPEALQHKGRIKSYASCAVFI